jgi:hypothetical protein
MHRPTAPSAGGIASAAAPVQAFPFFLQIPPGDEERAGVPGDVALAQMPVPLEPFGVEAFVRHFGEDLDFVWRERFDRVASGNRRRMKQPIAPNLRGMSSACSRFDSHSLPQAGRQSGSCSWPPGRRMPMPARRSQR